MQSNVINLSDYRKPQAVPSNEIIVGTRLHCILYGGKDGIVFEIQGHNVSVVFDNGSVSHVPASIVTSVQWRILPGIATQVEINQALRFARETTERNQREKEEAARQRELDREALKVEYSYLTQNPGSGGSNAAKNVRIELKRAWPKVKFSVRSSYDSININWTAGPTVKAVEAVTGKYQSGNFDGMTDCYNYNSSAFNDVFGGCRYVFENRDYSEVAIALAIDAVFAETPGNFEGMEKPSVDDFNHGRLWSVQVPGFNDDLQRLINAWLQNVTF